MSESSKKNTFDEGTYQFLTENILDVIWVMDLETRRFIYMSPRVEKLRGFTPEEVMSQDIMSALAPEFREGMAQKIQERFKRYLDTDVQEVFRDEVKQPCKDGSIIWTEIVSYIRKNPSNNRYEVIGTSRDISDRNEALSKLREKENQLSLIYNSSSEYMALFKVENGKNFVVESCNNAYIEAAKFFDIEITKENFIGMNLRNFLLENANMSKKEVEITIERYKSVFLNKKTIQFNESVILNKKRLISETVLSPVLDSKGDCSHILFTSRDISEKEKAKEELMSREESIRNVIMRTGSLKGEAFFGEMAKVMKEVTHATYSFIGKSSPKNKIKTIALAHKGALLDNFEYELTGTPCENVLNRTACIYPNNITTLFPDDQLLIDMGIEAYAGLPILDHSGQTIGIIVSLYDKAIFDTHNIESLFEIFSVRIGAEMELLSSEKALKDSEARYKMLSDLTNEGVVIHQEGKVLNLNKAFCELFGYSEEELLNHDDLLPLLLTPDSVKIAQEKIKTSYKGIYIVEGIKKDGSHIFIETDGASINYQNKKVRVATYRDVTARLKAEEQAQKLSKAVEHSPECIIITDKDGLIEYVNPRFEELTGYLFNEVKGKTTEILKSGEHDDEFYKNMWDVISSGSIWYGEFLNKKKNGELYWENASITGIMNDEGEITHYVAVKEDITEKKRILEDLKVAKEKAEESDQLKSAFLASMSHEIRTPLNSIVGFSSIIADSNEDPEMKRYSKLIIKQNDLLLQLIDDVIEFARVESGTIDLSVKQFSLVDLINSLYSKFNSKCTNDVSLKTHIALDQLHVISDEFRIQQIFTNLLSNAVKFTQHGTITFGFEINKKDEITCFVRDSGVGIPKKEQQNIFNRFTKLDIFTQGTGLGLAIIHHLVKIMDGSIWLDSEPGKGTTFYFRIPFSIKNANKMTIDMTDNKIRKQQENKPIVLIVEDDKSNYLFLKELVRAKKMESLFAENGNDAIKCCKENQVDLVLMDLKLPILDGYKATKAIKKFKPDLPIIAQTAYALAGDDIKAKDAGCDEYISKPILKEDLFKLIDKYI